MIYIAGYNNTEMDMICRVDRSIYAAWAMIISSELEDLRYLQLRLFALCKSN